MMTKLFRSALAPFALGCGASHAGGGDAATLCPTDVTLAAAEVAAVRALAVGLHQALIAT